MSEKPILFISHSSKDGHIAKVLKEQLEAVLDIEVWHSSDPDSIQAGSKWFQEIVHQLDRAKALLVLCSYNSRFSQWVQWEIGYFYKKSQLENGRLPIYVATIAGEKPFPTVAENQAKSLNDVKEIAALLSVINEHFFWDPELIDWRNIAEVIKDKCSKISVNENDVAKIRDYLKIEHREDIIITYDSLDENKKLTLGATKLILPSLLEETGWEMIPEKTGETGTQLRRFQDWESVYSKLRDIRAKFD